MNYIGCFNRSRDGLQVCSPFFFVPGAPQCCQVWSVALVPLCAVPGASMLPGVECYPCTFCAVPGVSMLPGVECCSRAPFCARSGAFLVPTLLRYTYYSISQILEFLQRCHSWQLVIDFIAYHRDQGIVNKYKYLRYKYIYYFINVKNK